MPWTEVVFYRDGDGPAPAYEAIGDLLRMGRHREFAKCQVRIARLAERGHELHRPEAEYPSHLMTKEGKVPDPERRTLRI